MIKLTRREGFNEFRARSTEKFIKIGWSPQIVKLVGSEFERGGGGLGLGIFLFLISGNNFKDDLVFVNI